MILEDLLGVLVLLSGLRESRVCSLLDFEDTE